MRALSSWLMACVVSVAAAGVLLAILLMGLPVVSGTSADDAQLSTFVGHWRGHSRGMDVFRTGRGREYIGGRPPIATLTFQVLRVAGTPAVANAQIRVTSVQIVNKSAFFGSLPRKGQIGILRLRRGVITDSTTRILYCAPGVDECDPISGPDPDDRNIA